MIFRYHCCGVINILFYIAEADGEVSEVEVKMIEHIAQIFGLNKSQFNGIKESRKSSDKLKLILLDTRYYNSKQIENYMSTPPRTCPYIRISHPAKILFERYTKYDYLFLLFSH